MSLDSSETDPARTVIDFGLSADDLRLKPLPPGAEATLTADLAIPFPEGLAPTPTPLDPEPQLEAALPKADVVCVTWTVAELEALADVFTPSFARNTWYRYRRQFVDHYLPLIRRGAPARQADRLGSYFLTTIGSKRVLCFKSELHLNQDGIRTGPGQATLPVRDLFAQIIEEVEPELVLTIGTSGGVAQDQDLGDAVVTRAARFRLSDEFANAPFNQRTVTSDWEIPTSRFAAAEDLMARFAEHLVEPDFGPPTLRYPQEGGLLRSEPPNRPSIMREGQDFDAFHPVLTTDSFEFGTSTNGLEQEGCAVEMGDAVLGLVCDDLENPPHWAIVRNISDPQINGALPRLRPRPLDMQAHWAVWYYEAFGYWTSVTGALATWAIIAGLDD